MKERILTGVFIALIISFAFLFREFTLYVFDALVLLLATYSAFEFSKLLSKCNLYNNKIIIMIYPALAYCLFLISMLTKLDFYISFVIQAGLLLLLVIGMFLLGLILKRKTENEIKTRNLNLRLDKFALYKSVHTLFGLLYPTVLLLPLFIINHLGEIGIYTNSNSNLLSLTVLIFAVLIPVITDVFCMLGGILFKGKKLCPKLSPNKTISGAISGIVFSVIICASLFLVLNATTSFGQLFTDINLQFWHIIVLSIIASVFCQCGDLFESFVKRRANVKDSGNLLPGHGGVLDRIDSHLFCYVVVLIFFVIILV